MKRIKMISILLMLSLVLLAMASCGSGSSEPEREDMAGFDPDTNQTIEVGGYSFEIPDYYVLNEELSGETNTDYQIAGGEAVVRFAFDETIASSEDEFEAIRDDYLKGLIGGVADDAEAAGNDFTCSVNDTPCSGRVELLYNDSVHTLVAAIFLQKDTSAADYLPDFKKVIRSARKPEAPASDEGSGGDDNVDADNNDSNDDADDVDDTDTGLISPEFKKTMDDYEAWFDHYCDVMKRYEDDPSDFELLSEVADLLSEETTMLEELESMDESEMNAAELAYYIEVTARIEKKLLELAY